MKITYQHLDGQRQVKKFDLMGDHRYFYPEVFKYGSRELAIALDPGTNALGMTIMDNKEGSVLTVIQIKRSNTITEADADAFTYTFAYKFLNSMLLSNTVKTVVIESQFINPKYGQHTYSVVNGFTKAVKSVISSKGVAMFDVPPPAWKKTLFEKFRKRELINLTQSNKEYIRERVLEMMPELNFFPKGDAFDSVGIAFHYLKVLRKTGSATEVIKVTTSMEKETRANIVMMMGVVDVTMTREEIMTRMNQELKISHGLRELYLFEPCDTMSGQENIRALIKNNNDMYLGFTKLYPKLFAELLMFRNEIGFPIREDQEIYIFGYRKNAK